MKFSSRVVRILSRFKIAVIYVLFPGKYYVYSKMIFAHHQMSFSLEGEDIIISRLLKEKKQGFYVDVGAHHPQRFSNTYYFYLKGWNGINIDPLPGTMEKFQEIRPRDINIAEAISDNREELTYYQFNEPAVNTFSEKLARKRNTLENYQLVGEKKIVTKRLEDILDKYLPEGQIIDFLNIDVEGFDLRVLQSNDWGKYRPNVVSVEDLTRKPLNKIQTSSVVTYLEEQGYELSSRSFNTLFFLLR